MTVSSIHSETIRVSGVVRESITDGPGIRYTLFVQGCPHHCPGCHNPHTFDFSGGYDMESAQVLCDIRSNPLCKGITFSGGEPFCQAEKLSRIAKELTESGYETAAYTGFTFEELLEMADAAEFLRYLDVLIDGPFLLEEKSLLLRFRGSKNQRILDVKESLKYGKAVHLEDKRWIG